MKADDFNMFQSLLKQRSGLVLSRDKAYLLESRLMPVARKWSLRGLDELAQAVRTKRDERLVKDITEAMTTNESSFFRDTKPFEQRDSGDRGAGPHRVVVAGGEQGDSHDGLRTSAASTRAPGWTAVRRAGT